jgi:diacylglycerol kinase (ATP)
MNKIPTKTTGLTRINKAFFYSLAGLKTAFKSEAAFRQELLLFIILLPVIFYLPINFEAQLILLLVNTLVLIVELLNSAIETAVDLVSPTYHKLAKNAKDIASGGVLVSLFLALFIWIITLINL